MEREGWQRAVLASKCPVVKYFSAANGDLKSPQRRWWKLTRAQAGILALRSSRDPVVGAVQNTWTQEDPCLALVHEVQRAAGRFLQGPETELSAKVLGLCWKDTLKSAELVLPLLQSNLRFLKFRP